MQFRSGIKYGLNEILFIVNTLGKKSIEEVAASLGRSKSGLRAKLNTSKRLEDGRTSLRGIKQYKNLAELYNAFGEELPTDPTKASEDVQRRIDEFQQQIKESAKSE